MRSFGATPAASATPGSSSTAPESHSVEIKVTRLRNKTAQAVKKKIVKIDGGSIKSSFLIFCGRS